MTEKPKFKRQKCFICNGDKFTETGFRDEKTNKLEWVKTICFNCLGLGYIKIPKESK